MSVEAMLAVQRLQVRTTHACFRVLMTLAEHANATGRNSWPSIDTIAAESQTDGKTTWRCLGALEKLELIVGERGRGRGRTTIWALNFPVRPLGKDGAKPGIPIETTPEKDGMTWCIEHEIPGTTPSFVESKHGMTPGIPRLIDGTAPGLSPLKDGMTPEKDGMTPSKPVLNLRRESRGRPTDRLDDQVNEAVSIWNDVLPKSKAEIPAGRRASLRARLADEMGGQLENWRSFCQHVRAAPFLVGESERGWRADLDWCLKPANMAKILAGNYDQRSATPVHRPGHSYAGCL